jgi:DegV family protein with EDD domain
VPEAGVTVVTDTTTYLPAELARRAGLRLISMYYVFAGEAPRRELDDDDFGLFYERLRTADPLPTTTPPPVEDFVGFYEPLLADGGSVVSIHISSGLSETCANARRAAQMVEGGERIHVLDSASAGGQLGLLALAAARAAAAGRSAEEVADLVRQARIESRSWFLVDTLDYLKRGGRIGGAVAWIGSTLNIKPLLSLESEIRAVERIRTRSRAIDRLVELGRQLRATGASCWMVQHTRVPDDAAALAERLREVFWRPPEFVAEIGPCVGTHTGPGMLAIGGMPARFLE